MKQKINQISAYALIPVILFGIIDAAIISWSQISSPDLTILSFNWW